MNLYESGIIWAIVFTKGRKEAHVAALECPLIDPPVCAILRVKCGTCSSTWATPGSSFIALPAK